MPCGMAQQGTFFAVRWNVPAPKPSGIAERSAALRAGKAIPPDLSGRVRLDRNIPGAGGQP